MRKVLSIAGQEQPDHHRLTGDIKQWMASTVNTKLNQLFYTPFYSQAHHRLRPALRLIIRCLGSVTVSKRLAGQLSWNDSWNIVRSKESADDEDVMLEGGEVVRPEMSLGIDRIVFLLSGSLDHIP